MKGHIMVNGLSIEESLYKQNPYLAAQYGTAGTTATTSQNTTNTNTASTAALMNSMYGYDPYFAAAYNSPNFYGTASQTTASTNNTAGAATTNSTAATAGSSNATVNSSSTQENKSSHSAAGAILGTIALVGAGVLCARAHNKGAGEGFWNKTKDGFKQMWNGLFKGSKSNTLGNPTEYTIKNAGTEFVVKDGIVTKVVTTNRETLIKDQLNTYISNNNNIKNTISKLDIEENKKLPEHVKKIGNGNNVSYRYKDSQSGDLIYFDADKNITKIEKAERKEFVKQEDIDKLMESNKELKSDYDKIKTGTTPDGYKRTKEIYKAPEGQSYVVKKGKIKSIILSEKTTIEGKEYKAGDVIYGHVMEEWSKLAENDKSWKAMQDVLKSAKE